MDPNHTTTPAPDVHVNNVPPAQPPVQGTPPTNAPAPAPKQSGGVGPVVGIVIIIVVLIFGGLYFWGAQLNQQAAPATEAPLEQIDTTPEPAATDPTAIEGELNSFDTADFDAQLDTELNAIESQL